MKVYNSNQSYATFQRLGLLAAAKITMAVKWP